MPAASISRKTHERIHEMVRGGVTKSEIGRVLKIDRVTVIKYAKVPVPVKSATLSLAADDFPEATHAVKRSVQIDTPGWWLVMSDLHIPHHDSVAVKLAVAEAVKLNAVGVILNGDVLDCHMISRFDKDLTQPKLVDEIKMAQQFLGWLRGQLPKAQIFWKEGNHEERLLSYVVNNCAALFGLECLEWASLIDAKKWGVAYVGDRKRIDLGKLPIVHGHEFQRGISAPVSAARGLFMRAKSTAMCGHHHQTSNHREADVRRKEIATWTTGCLCSLSPMYNPFNNWNHGFAMVEVSKGGMFNVSNCAVFNGEITG